MTKIKKIALPIKIQQEVQRLKKLPSAKVLVELAMTAKNESKVTSKNINELRQTCNDIADSIAETYYKDSFSAILHKFKNKPLSDDDNFNWLLTALIKESPKIVVSMANSRMPVGGKANELLYHKFLEGAGLIYGKNFEKLSGRGKDLRITSRWGNKKLLVEVKSLKVRERSARTGANRRLKVVLAGFFDNPAEFSIEQTREMSRVYEVVYLPPLTLKSIKDQSKKVKNSRNKPLLRNNTLFAKEIQSFALTGELP